MEDQEFEGYQSLLDKLFRGKNPSNARYSDAKRIYFQRYYLKNRERILKQHREYHKRKYVPTGKPKGFQKGNTLRKKLSTFQG